MIHRVLSVSGESDQLGLQTLIALELSFIASVQKKSTCASRTSSTEAFNLVTSLMKFAFTFSTSPFRPFAYPFVVEWTPFLPP